VQILSNSNNKFPGKGFIGESLQQRKSILLMNLNPLFNNFAKPFADPGLIMAMAARANKAGRRTNIILVLF
jgi:hypothetical protein